jgi:hypothetical protein
MAERNPADDPRVGDIVRSRYVTIGERHIIGANNCGVKYWRVRPTGKRQEGYCLPSIWRKWCRAHGITVVQLAD